MNEILLTCFVGVHDRWCNVCSGLYASKLSLFTQENYNVCFVNDFVCIFIVCTHKFITYITVNKLVRTAIESTNKIINRNKHYNFFDYTVTVNACYMCLRHGKLNCACIQHTQWAHWKWQYIDTKTKHNTRSNEIPGNTNTWIINQSFISSNRCNSCYHVHDFKLQLPPRPRLVCFCYIGQILSVAFNL